MPIEDYPAPLRPFVFLGLELSYRNGAESASANCIFCDREGRLNINAVTSLWRCPACDESGNSRTFARKLHSASLDATPAEAYKQLAADRRLLYPDTLMHWELARSILTDDWLVPGYGANGKLNTLYRYVRTERGRMALLPTTTFGHYLLGVNLLKKKAPVVFLCEGVWDAMALWESMAVSRLGDESLEPAPYGSPECLLANASVLAIPTATAFAPAWVDLFADKEVRLVGQNDHPHKNEKTGAMIEPASLSGMRRIAKLLGAAATPPVEVLWAQWGEEGFNPELPHGYDVRDFITKPR